MNERRYQGEIERLRAPERLARLEVGRVVDTTLAGIAAKTVFDVGAGSGVFAETFAERGLDVTGVDINAAMVDAARLLVPGAHFEVAPAEALPFPDQSFDLGFLGLVLHEADDLLKALAEARRVARQRVAVLEWPYRQEEMPPPLAHRLQPEAVEALARQAGYRAFEAVLLTHTVLYQLTC